MQNPDQEGQSPVIGPFGHGASHSLPLGAPGRRRTQEQGQGDLDDDRQDTTPTAAPEAVPRPGQMNPEAS